MTTSQFIESFFRRHPVVHGVWVIILAVVAVCILLGGLRNVGLVYKAF